MKTIVLKCDDCLGSFDATKHIVKQVDIIINGDELSLTYFDCPLCGRRYDVLIDNQETLRVKRDTDSISRRIRTNTRKGRCSTEYQVAKMVSTQAKLKNLYNDLINRYNMSSYQIGDVKYQLNVTMPKFSMEEVKGEDNNV